MPSSGMPYDKVICSHVPGISGMELIFWPSSALLLICFSAISEQETGKALLLIGLLQITVPHYLISVFMSKKINFFFLQYQSHISVIQYSISSTHKHIKALHKWLLNRFSNELIKKPFSSWKKRTNHQSEAQSYSLGCRIIFGSDLFYFYTTL